MSSGNAGVRNVSVSATPAPSNVQIVRVGSTVTPVCGRAGVSAPVPSTRSPSIDATAARIVFVGHVHHPQLYFTTPGGALRAFAPVPGVAMPLSDFRRWLVIVGSAGQPRDGNPAACYALHDSAAGTLTHYRVPYDARAAANRILEAGLPERLAWRLIRGE